MPEKRFYLLIRPQSMQKYELMAIVENSLDSESAEKFCQEKIVDKIKSLKGSITFEDFWGERGFAYKINKQTWGYYFVTQFDSEPEILTELNRDLNLENGLVRFLISKVDKKDPAPRKYAEVKSEYEAQEKSKKEEKIVEKPKTATRTKLTTIKKEEPKKDAVDKKLDDIVSESVKDL